VGGVFRTAREAMGLSLVEVATRVGVEPDHLERVELGEEVAPQSFTTRLAETLAELMTSRIAATP
jgi:predicted transcriptional regulator